jgi:hypothetical protein
MGQIRKRLFIDRKTGTKEREKLIKLAVENECNTLVFSLNDNIFKNRNPKYVKLIERYALNVEAGGCNLPLLLPKRLFLFHPDLFRMEQGRRKPWHHFCPTNPKTTAIISKQVRKLFTRALQVVTSPAIFHLFPEKGYEEIWCACPACRAFKPPEQYLIVVNTAADELAKMAIDAKIAYIDYDTAPDDSPRLTARKNAFVLRNAD